MASTFRISDASVGFLFDLIVCLLGAQESPRAQRIYPDLCTTQALRIRGDYGHWTFREIPLI